MSENQIIHDEWDMLDAEARGFVLRVHLSNGCKHGSDPISVDTNEVVFIDSDGHKYFGSRSLYELPENLGFIHCVGSYKWITTNKFIALSKFLFMGDLL